MSSFNYSKWDKIELSDDESDLHPNVKFLFIDLYFFSFLSLICDIYLYN
jgi:hypothetical protein